MRKRTQLYNGLAGKGRAKGAALQSRQLFDYQCVDCGTTFEELARVGDVVPCPKCPASDTTRLISAPRMDPRLGIYPDSYPSMGDKWARKHEQRRRAEESRAAKDE